MKKLILILAMVMVFSGVAFALLDDNSTNATATAVQGQQQGQAQLQGQGQGQLQGQIGSVDVQDNSKTTAIMFPSTGATEGVASANATYMFGNLGLSDTEMYKKGGYIVQTVLAIPDDVLSQQEKKEIVKMVVSKMLNSVKPRRLLGIGPEQHSKNLINLFGLLSFDSVWADGQRPFQRKADIK